ncbi:MAG: peptide ABC transporter substrate-binding protein [Deltaproteobacteria bacterium]|nr:peptide ABC transporter substrate-binding protein [Deltaproteobacteria bacterium]
MLSPRSMFHSPRSPSTLRQGSGQASSGRGTVHGPRSTVHGPRSRLLCCLFVHAFVLLGGTVASATHTLLRIHIESEPSTLDPAQATGLREHLILQGLFEGLTRYHPKTLEPLPGAAEKWKISKDGKVYQFFLRKDAKWNDGKPLTAIDFWNAWEHLLNPKTHSPYNFFLFHLKGGKDYAQGLSKDPGQIGMEVKDPHHFVVTLEKPVPYFLYLTSFASLAPRRKDVPLPEVKTNGAFQLSFDKQAKGTLIVPNPHYWGKGEVKLHGILFRPFGDFDTALKFYARTGIDIMVELPPAKVPLLKFRSDFRSAPVLRTDYLLIQMEKPPLNIREVRQALAYAIDRKKITDEVLKRGDLPYGYFVPPGMPLYNHPEYAQTFDPWKAKHLLDKAGFNAQNKFPTITLQYNKATDRKMVAEAVASMWDKYLGIKVQLLEEKWDGYLKRRNEKNFEVSWGAWYGDYLDPNSFLELFVSDNRQNHAAFSNAAYDALIAEAQNTQDKMKRAKLYQQAETLLLHETAVIPILARVKAYLIQPYVKGYELNLLDIHPWRDVYSLRP